MKFLSRRKTSRSPIGLDIGARRIKAVQLEPSMNSASGWRVAAVATVSRATPGKPLNAGEAMRLGDTLDRLGFTGTQVVLAAPSDKLISGMLELPRAAQISLEQIARIELARTNKVTPESFEMGCWELPVPARAGKAAHVMAVGYAHADANTLLDLVEAAGLDVAAMDVRSCALARACNGVISQPPGITALLDMGWATASLVLVYSGMVVYVRALTEAGINRVYEGLATRLKLEADVADYLVGEVGLLESAASTSGQPTLPTDAKAMLAGYADAMVRELLTSFAYVARQYTDASVTRLLTMGAGASIPGLQEYLTNELGLETMTVSPRDLTECPTSMLEACSSPELTPAIGLAQFPEI